MLRPFERSLSIALVAIVISAMPLLAWSADAESTKAPQWMQPPSGALVVDGLLQAAAGWTQLDDSAIDGRPVLSAHRVRLWLRGKAHERLRYVIQFSGDRVGADNLALLQGKSLSQSRFPTVLDAVLQADLLSSGALRVTGGFFRPSVGRENNTIVPALPSHEASLSATLARRGSVQHGHGRAAGLNLGGHVRFGSIGLVYQAGIFAPLRSGTSSTGVAYTDSLGASASPLTAGNLVVTFGDVTQFRAGDLLWMGNPWDFNPSGTLGVSASYQGETDQWAQSTVMTGFGSVQWRGLFADAEWVQAMRESASGTVLTNRAWHVRLGYNIKLDTGLLSPFAMLTEMSSDSIDDQTQWEGELSALGLFAGGSRLINVGVNWHLRLHQLRVGLHGIVSDRSNSDNALNVQPVRFGWTALLNLQVGS